MLYVIFSEDVADSLARRKVARPDHIRRLNVLQKQGRILAGGPLPAIDSNEPGEAGFTGSILIAEFGSLAEAKTWAAKDPYCKAGVYARSIVKPFKQVFP